jgi:hypothetical protein
MTNKGPDVLPTSADTGSTEEDDKKPAAVTIPRISNSSSATTETTNAIDTAVASAVESECTKTRFSAILSTMPPSSQQAFITGQLEKFDKQAEDTNGVLLEIATSVENIAVNNSNNKTSVLKTFLHHKQAEDANGVLQSVLQSNMKVAESNMKVAESNMKVAMKVVESNMKVAEAAENIFVVNSNNKTSLIKTFLHHQERDGEDGDESSSSDDNNSL